MNYWPGFVDALSTLVLSVIFLLTVFMVAQFYLSQEVAGKDTALDRLNAQIARLSQLLSLEQTGKASLEDEVTNCMPRSGRGKMNAIGCARRADKPPATVPAKGQAQPPDRPRETGDRPRHRADRESQ